MLRRKPPMTNAERQRRFRARNPGYRNRYRARVNPDEVRATVVAALAAVKAATAGSAGTRASGETDEAGEVVREGAD